MKSCWHFCKKHAGGAGPVVEQAGAALDERRELRDLLLIALAAVAGVLMDLTCI